MPKVDNPDFFRIPDFKVHVRGGFVLGDEEIGKFVHAINPTTKHHDDPFTYLGRWYDKARLRGITLEICYLKRDDETDEGLNPLKTMIAITRGEMELKDLSFTGNGVIPLAAMPDVPNADIQRVKQWLKVERDDFDVSEFAKRINYFSRTATDETIAGLIQAVAQAKGIVPKQVEFVFVTNHDAVRNYLGRLAAYDADVQKLLGKSETSPKSG